MPLTVVQEINVGTLSMQVASAAIEDGDWQMAREALSEACMQAMRALHEVDQRMAPKARRSGVLLRRALCGPRGHQARPRKAERSVPPERLF